MTMKIKRISGYGLVACGIVAAAALIADQYVLHLLILSAVWGLFGTGWNLAFGTCGLKAFGHQAFFALAAYTSALLSMHFEMSPWLTCLIGAGAAAVMSLIVVAPVLRLRSAPQIAIATLAFAEILRILILNLKDLTRGEMGLIGIPAFNSVAGLEFNVANKTGYFVVIALVLLLAIGLTDWFRSSKYGKATVAIRDSIDAAQSLGLYATLYRVVVFAVSAFIVGLAGAFYAHYLQILTPSDVASSVLMVMVISMVIVGGVGSIIGPLVGALLMTLGLESFRAFDDYRLLVYGLFVLLAIRFLPNGLVPGLGTLREWKSRPTAEKSMK